MHQGFSLTHSHRTGGTLHLAWFLRLCCARPDLLTWFPGALPALIRPVTGGRHIPGSHGMPLAPSRGCRSTAARRRHRLPSWASAARPSPEVACACRAPASACGWHSLWHGDSAGDQGGLKPVPPAVTPQLLRLECRGSSSQQCCCFLNFY